MRNYSVSSSLENTDQNYCQTIKLSVWLKQFYILLTQGKKRLGLNVFGELAERSIFWWRIVSSCVTLLDKIWKNTASDFPSQSYWWRKKKIPSFHRLLVGNVKLTFSHLVAALCVQLCFLNYEDFRTEIGRKAVKIGDLSFQNIWSFICSRFLKRKKIDPKSTKLLNRTFKTLKKATSKLYWCNLC